MPVELCLQARCWRLAVEFSSFSLLIMLVGDSQGAELWESCSKVDDMLCCWRFVAKFSFLMLITLVGDSQGVER